MWSAHWAKLCHPSGWTLQFPIYFLINQTSVFVQGEGDRYLFMYVSLHAWMCVFCRQKEVQAISRTNLKVIRHLWKRGILQSCHFTCDVLLKLKHYDKTVDRNIFRKILISWFFFCHCHNPSALLKHYIEVFHYLCNIARQAANTFEIKKRKLIDTKSISGMDHNEIINGSTTIFWRILVYQKLCQY